MITEALAGALAPLVMKHGEDAITKFLEHLHQDGSTLACQGAIRGWYCTRRMGHDGPCAALPMVNDNISEAWRLTHGDRRAAYGTPSQVFAGYAKMWSGILARKLKEDLTASDVALLMTALKLARHANAPAKDNIVDAHGYLIMADEVLL